MMSHRPVGLRLQRSVIASRAAVGVAGLHQWPSAGRATAVRRRLDRGEPRLAMAGLSLQALPVIRRVGCMHSVVPPRAGGLSVRPFLSRRAQWGVGRQRRDGSGSEQRSRTLGNPGGDRLPVDPRAEATGGGARATASPIQRQRSVPGGQHNTAVALQGVQLPPLPC